MIYEGTTRYRSRNTKDHNILRSYFLKFLINTAKPTPCATPTHITKFEETKIVESLIPLDVSSK